MIQKQYVMLQEQYVSFETAKLLREKEFNIQTMFVYSDQGELLRLSDYGIKDLSNDDCYKYQQWEYPIEGAKSIVSAPSQALAMAWIRETYNVYIMVDKDFATINGWHYYIIKESYEANGSMHVQQESNGYSYEEAAEEAIKYALNNLI